MIKLSVRRTCSIPNQREAKPSPLSKRSRLLNGWFYFFLLSLAILLLWTQILPKLEGLGSIGSYIERMKDHGINPSAIYYTEHPSHNEWENTLRERISRNPQAFWRPLQSN